MSWKAFHDGLVRLVGLDRHIDPFFRPVLDAVLREPLAIATQGRRSTIPRLLLELQNLFADSLSCEKIVTAGNENLIPSACRREGVNSFVPDP